MEGKLSDVPLREPGGEDWERSFRCELLVVLLLPCVREPSEKQNRKDISIW